MKPIFRLLNQSTFSGSHYLFVLSFEDNGHRVRHTGYFLPIVEIKDYQVMIDKQNFLDQSVKNDLTTNDNFKKTMIGQGDHHTTDGLLYHPSFKEDLITIDLSKQQALDPDLKKIHLINFTRNLHQP